jgi:hypothetical protein
MFRPNGREMAVVGPETRSGAWSAAKWLPAEKPQDVGIRDASRFEIGVQPQPSAAVKTANEASKRYRFGTCDSHRLLISRALRLRSFRRVRGKTTRFGPPIPAASLVSNRRHSAWLRVSSDAIDQLAGSTGTPWTHT